MTGRPVLFAAVLGALAAAIVGGSLAAPPTGDLPGIALRSTLVWRVEVGAVVFAALYGAIVIARLALHGKTIARVGSSGIEIPQVWSGMRTPRAVAGEDEIDRLIDHLRITVIEHARRLDRLEHAHDLVLHHDEGAT